uniref:Ammonium transporter n=1 Tax=Plectus sambesii TaxID=2011161 RepID=A0A914VCS0_9BILA
MASGSSSVTLDEALARLSTLNESIVAYHERLDFNNDAFFLISMSIIIFMMQFGFAFLEAGCVRSKNTTNILIKNLLDSCIASIAYFFCGWAFAYGTRANPFCGFGQFLMIGLEPAQFPRWFFQFTFTAAASTIVSGAVAERCEFIAYLVYSTLISGFVYPVITHWVWDQSGWLANGPEGIQFKDFAGSGVVHLHGGTTALIAAIILGPRIGRFPDKKTGTPAVPIKGHSTPFVAMGAFMLMFGFFAFNGGSQGTLGRPGDGETVARAVSNTMLCSGWAAITVLLINKLLVGKKWSMLLSINAALAGMVSACSGCDALEPWACSVVGIGSGICYFSLSILVEKVRIDDPVDAIAVHFGGGLWGVIIAPIMMHEGIIYTGSRRAFLQWGWNLVGAAAIFGWSFLVMGTIFLILRITGFFRVPRDVELKGLDIYKHGEDAYPQIAYGHGWDKEEPSEDYFSNSTHSSYVRHRTGNGSPNGYANGGVAIKLNGSPHESDQMRGEHVHVWTHRNGQLADRDTYSAPSLRLHGERPENVHHARRRMYNSNLVQPENYYSRHPGWYNYEKDSRHMLHL